MALYSERNANTILTFATDPEGATMFISKVNGDPGLVGASVGLSIGGAAIVAFDGTVTYDDTGLPPFSVGTQLADSLIATVSDGVNEVDVTVNLELLGVTDTSAVTVDIGTYTRAGAGGVPVSGTSITQGNDDGYFQITGGVLSLSLAGQGSVMGMHVLTLNDGSTVNIDIVPNRFDVGTASDLIAACKAAEAIAPGTDFDIVIRDGSIIGAEKVSLRIENIVMNGTLQDVNAGAPNASYDVDAVADITGGSITIRSETPLAATIAGHLRLEGCHGFIIRDLTFTNAALDTDTLSYNRNNSSISNGPAAALYQLEVKTDSFHPFRGVAIIANNLFTQNPGKAPGHWANGIFAHDTDTVIVQDNVFDKLRNCANGSSIDRWVLTRNFARDYVVDCFRCFGHNGTISGSAVRWEATKNVVLHCLDDVDFANEHSDAFQYGTLVDQHPTDIFIHKNHIFAPVNARTFLPGGVQRSTQGVFGNHNGSGQQLFGEVSNNFVLISAFWAIYIDAGSNVQVTKNTIINDTISPILYDMVEPRLLFKASSVSCVCSRNIGGNISAEAGAGVVFFPENMDTLDGQALAGGNAYAAVFAGPFGFESGRGATFVVDTTSAATTRADIDSIFAPLPGGAGNGKGHLV